MSELKATRTTPKIGLVLTGGGARAAYQVGVLRAISEFLPDARHNPFPVVCGTSAGAINAASIAVSADNFSEGIRQLEAVWENFHVDHIHRSDLLGVLGNGMHCLASLISSEFGNKQSSASLLDNTPLRMLLENRFPFGNIQRCINKGSLHAIGLTASGYTSGQSVTFFQAAKGTTYWKRAQRVGVAARLNAKHLLASSAIPFIFPAVRLNREYFGDGSMRQLAPISPALHLGADKVLIIGVQKAVSMPKRVKVTSYPPFAQIAGHAMNSIFIDGLDVDLERLQRINQTLKLVPSRKLKENNVLLRPIESMIISPSEEINEIALKHAQALPLIMRFLYRAIGAMGPNGSTLLSYVLFEAPFCKALIELGYRDTVQRKDEILRFIGVDELRQ